MSVQFARVLAAAVLAGSVVTLGDAAGAGSSCPAADMKIARRPDGPFLGNNDCGNQALNVTLALGQTKTYYVKVQNDANAKRTWDLHGPAGDADLVMKYFTGFTGGTNITADVENPPPNYEFSVGAHKTKRFRWKVRLPADSSDLSHGLQMQVRPTGETGGLDDVGLHINDP